MFEKESHRRTNKAKALSLAVGHRVSRAVKGWEVFRAAGRAVEWDMAGDGNNNSPLE
jgi:hypothetical protein